MKKPCKRRQNRDNKEEVKQAKKRQEYLEWRASQDRDTVVVTGEIKVNPSRHGVIS